MKKIKKNKKAEAWKLEVNEIDRQIRERLELKNKLGAIRQQLGSTSLPNLTPHHDAVVINLRENPCNIETTVKR